MKIPHALFILVLMLGASLAACATKPAAASPATASGAESAWKDCVQSIQKQQKLSSEDGPAYTPAGVKALDNGKFNVNVYYPKTGTNYRCGIQQQPDGNC
jgi:hypothetical protein